MINSIPSSALFVYLDKVSEPIPGFSTAMSFAHLFVKHAILPCLKESTIRENHYFTHLSHSNSVRKVALLVPFLGNIAVWVYDRYAQMLLARALFATDISISAKINLYEQAASHGNVPAMILLGFHHLDVTQNVDAALKLFTEALKHLPSITDREIYFLECAATRKNTQAMTLLALYYMTRSDTRDKAMKLLKRAVEFKNPQAMAYLGLYHITSGKDFDKAKKLFEQLSESNSITIMIQMLEHFATLGGDEALALLGFFNVSGFCFKKNTPKGMELLEKAVQLDKPLAKAFLGIELIETNSIERGLKLLHEAADAEVCLAIVQLAIYYSEGKHVDKSLRDAFSLLQKAVDLGDAEAMVLLGAIYRDAGSPKDAVKLFKQALELDKDMIEFKLSQLNIDLSEVA